MQNKILIFMITFFISFFSFAKNKNTEKFQKPIKKYLPEIQSCNSEADTKITGKVVVDLEINDNASFQRIKINEEQTTLQNLNIQKCVIDKMKKIKFPKAEKGEIVSFSYAVDFK